MATEKLQNLMFISGRLVHSPTDLTAAYPHGGTELGYAREITLIPSQVTTFIRGEEFGQTIVEAIEGGRSWVLGANLRGWDDDAIDTFFPGTALGTTTGRRYITETTTSPQPGALLSSRAIELLFVPDDTDNYPIILFRRALPLVEEAAELAFALRSEFTIPVMFIAIPDTDGKIIDIGWKQDITI